MCSLSFAPVASLLHTPSLLESQGSTKVVPASPSTSPPSLQWLRLSPLPSPSVPHPTHAAALNGHPAGWSSWPPGRAGHAMVPASDGTSACMFGGYGGRGERS